MTELIWDGKYDANGKKAAPLRVSLPFQTVETVNESAQERQRMLDLFSAGRDTAWRNRLIWGDKKYVLPSLLDEFAGKVNLIYIDPPFNVGADFSFTTTIHPEDDGDDGEPGASFIKEPSVIEQKAYRDTWGRGLDSYLQWFCETVVLLREMLIEDGSIYVHIDYHVGHYVKAILDDVFGAKCFQNEIIWQRTDSHNDARSRFGNIHDTIFWYGKNERPKYYPDVVRTNLSASALAEFSLLELPDGRVLSYKDNTHLEGRRVKLDDATWRGTNSKKKFEWRGAKPSMNREWVYSSPEEMDEALAQGELYLRDPSKGAARCRKSYLDENKGLLLQDIWTDAGRMKGGSTYATQKPEALLERIIKASSNEGDLVLDCFCGSGTTAATAEKLNRRWITCDLGRFAIHTARKRLLSISGVRPFVVQNLGKYERQVWQAAEFTRAETLRSAQGDKPTVMLSEAKHLAAHRAYTDFILNLYNARPVSGYTWLHGLKGGRMVHVGAVDAPIALGDITQIVTEFKKAVGTGQDAPTRNSVDVLGWDFAFELNEVAKQHAERANLNLRFIRIPNDVMDKRAVEQGDIRFFELAALAVDVKKKG